MRDEPPRRSALTTHAVPAHRAAAAFTVVDASPGIGLLGVVTARELDQ